MTATAEPATVHAGPISRLGDSPFVALAVRIGLLLIMFIILQWWVLGVARLPASSYTQPSLTLEVFKSLLGATNAGSLVRLGLFLGFLALGVRYFGRLWVPWAEIDHGRLLRVVVVVPVIVLTWVYATYDYNLYFDRAHLLDRLALVALAAAIWWRPIAVAPFSILVVAIAWQFHYPITPYSVAEQFMLLRIGLLFVSFFLLYGVFGAHRASDLMFTVLTLIAASFFAGGLGKLSLSWFTYGHVALLLPATYANGWMGLLEAPTIAAITARLARLDWLLVGATFAVECGAIVSLWRRNVFAAFLGGCIAFHLGVVALSGIFFWKWIVVEAALLIVLLRHRASPALAMFTPSHFLLSLVLIPGGVRWFNPVNLSWYNAPVTYTYRFDAITEDGERYSLPPQFFAPYDYQFTQGGFGYLVADRQLGIMWGATWDRESATALLDAQDAHEVQALENERGQIYFNAERTKTLDRFLRRFIEARNAHGSTSTLLRWLGAPPQLLSFARPDAYRRDDRIVQVQIHQVTSYFDGTSYEEIRTRPVHTVEIVPKGVASQ